jgi:hypothetical protein
MKRNLLIETCGKETWFSKRISKLHRNVALFKTHRVRNATISLRDFEQIAFWVVSGPEDVLPFPHFSWTPPPLIPCSGSLPCLLFSVFPQTYLLTLFITTATGSRIHYKYIGMYGYDNTSGQHWRRGMPNWWEIGTGEDLLNTERIRYSHGTYWRDTAHKSI